MTRDTLNRVTVRFAVPIALIAVGMIVGVTYQAAGGSRSAAESSAAPPQGMTLPIHWGDLGKKLVDTGVIDRKRFLALYPDLAPEDKALLDGGAGDLRVTPGNASYMLNLLWALGLGNKNMVLTKEMMDPAYDGAGGFASTGGWTIAVGDSMGHYNKHTFVTLTPAQQARVDKISLNVYRPCCDNPTHFPDCNHGMAMLGLLELMASQRKSEDEMYRAALTANSYWFPDQYQTLAAYFSSKDVDWKDMPPKEVLNKQYSSASGYAKIAALMQSKQSGGGSCSV